MVTSLASLVDTLRRVFTDRDDPRPTAEDRKHQAHPGIECAMAFDDSGAEGGCTHVQYHDLVTDPIAELKRIHARAGEQVSPLEERRMLAGMRERPPTAFGRRVYDPADFGWTYPEFAEEFTS